MLVTICHNNGMGKPPKEAVKHFPSAVSFRHFSGYQKHNGYMFWSQIDIAEAENLAVTRENELQWVDFDTYRIGGL